MRIYPQLLLLASLGSCFLFEGLGAADCDDASFIARCDGDILTFCESGFVNHETCAQACIVDGDGAACTVCGNDLLEPGEECDGGDNCRDDCTIPRCGDNIVDDDELCDSTPGCSATCVSLCGDNIIQPGEACDEGDTADGDGCRADCTGLEVCGDGLTDVFEECDDGDNNSADGCSGACQLEECGDGVLNFNPDTQQIEECDDGNATEGDGCDSNCTITACDNDIASPGELCLINAPSTVTIQDKTPSAIAVGDIDGANGPDLVFSSDPDGVVSILFNDGAGGFQAASLVEHDASNGFANPQQRDVALGDLDDDGDLDIVIADLTANAIVIATLSNGGQGAVISSLAASGEPIAVRPSDLNGDQLLDIVAINRQGNVASIFLQDAAGAFNKVDVGTGTFPLSFDIGDLDGDGDLDIITTNRTSRSFSVLLNDGAGVFTPSEIGAANQNVHGVVLLDIDVDGKLDVISSFDPAAGVSEVELRRNIHAAGVFSAASLAAPQDIFASLAPVLFLMNTGELNSQAPVDLVVAEVNSGSASIALAINSFASATLALDGLKDFVVADLNQDGAGDIAGAISGINVVISVILAAP